MRADRLLSILMLLQTRGRATAQELAAELEVSERTIYRDVTALSTAGVPVYAERGPGGGIRLVERYRSDLTGLNKDEVQALSMLNIPPALSDLGLDHELKAALLKLSAALPAASRGTERHIRQRIYIDPLPWDASRTEIQLPHLPTVQQAVWTDRLIEIRYRSVMGKRVGPLDALIRPYGLVSKGGFWYLVGKRRDHIGVLRVDFILEASLKDETCTRPDDFDLPAFWAQWCQEESGNRPYFPVLARVSPKLIPNLKKLFGAGILAHLPQAEEPASMDWITLELPFEYHEQALEHLLPWGGSIEVLEPISLRYTIQDYARQILAVYS